MKPLLLAGLIPLLLEALALVAWILLTRRGRAARARELGAQWLGAVCRREWALARLLELEAEAEGVDVRQVVADTDPPIEPDRRS